MGHALTKIFICYRREDSKYATGRIYDRLEHHFGRGQVFMDVDDIPFGVDYRDWLDRQIRDSALVLAVIGRDWLSAADPKQGRRLDAPRDFVRTEIKIALDRNIPLIPILLEGAAMPGKDDLPAAIRPLAYRNAARVHAAGGEFRGHMERLIRGIQWQLDQTAAPAPTQQTTAPSPPGPKEADGRNPRPGHRSERLARPPRR